MHAFDPARVESLFKQLEFRSLLPRFYEVAKAYGHMIDGHSQLSLFTNPSGSLDCSTSTQPNQGQYHRFNPAIGGAL